MEVIYTYIRRGVTRRAQCHTLDQALRLAWYHRENGGAWPVGIATREDAPIFDQRGLRAWMDRDEFPV
jgi:hypothetical protein